MKKILLVLSLAASSMAPVYANNVAAGFVYDMGWGVGAQFNNNINVMVGNNGVSVDYLFFQDAIDDAPLSWYIGAGGSAEWDGGPAARLPVGLNWNINAQWNAYGHVTPYLGFDDGAEFGLGAGAGVRYRF